MWRSLPEDARATIERNAAKFVSKQRTESAALNDSL